MWLISVFSLFWYFHPPFCCDTSCSGVQQPFLSADIADYGKAATECKLCAVSLPGLRSLHQIKDVCRVPTKVSPGGMVKEYTGGKKLSVPVLLLVFLNLLHNCWTMVSPRFLSTSILSFHFRFPMLTISDCIGDAYHKPRRSLGHTWQACLAVTQSLGVNCCLNVEWMLSFNPNFSNKKDVSWTLSFTIFYYHTFCTFFSTYSFCKLKTSQSHHITKNKTEKLLSTMEARFHH